MKGVLSLTMDYCEKVFESALKDALLSQGYLKRISLANLMPH